MSKKTAKLLLVAFAALLVLPTVYFIVGRSKANDELTAQVKAEFAAKREAEKAADEKQLEQDNEDWIDLYRDQKLLLKKIRRAAEEIKGDPTVNVAVCPVTGLLQEARPLRARYESLNFRHPAHGDTLYCLRIIYDLEMLQGSYLRLQNKAREKTASENYLIETVLNMARKIDQVADRLEVDLEVYETTVLKS